MNHSEWIRTLRGLLQLAGEKLEVHSEDVELGYETEPADAVEARTRWELALSRVNRPYQAFLRSNTATEEQKAAVRDTWRTAQRTWKQGEDLNRTVDFAADAISKLDAITQFIADHTANLPPPLTQEERKAAASDAARHTTGNYRQRNAAIATLTKFDLLEACTEAGWTIYQLSNTAAVVADFKATYDAMGAGTLMADEVEDRFVDLIDQSMSIIAGFQTLGQGDPALAGGLVNRGDSEGMLIGMGVAQAFADLEDGTETAMSLQAKFPGATSTAKGGNPASNQYAVRASVVWILTVAEVNHAFDFMEIVGEGYAGEEELTFPMGTKVSITKVVTHRDAAHAGMRPAGCSAAKYTIYGTIHWGARRVGPHSDRRRGVHLPRRTRWPIPRAHPNPTSWSARPGTSTCSCPERRPPRAGLARDAPLSELRTGLTRRLRLREHATAPLQLPPVGPVTSRLRLEALVAVVDDLARKSGDRPREVLLIPEDGDAPAAIETLRSLTLARGLASTASATHPGASLTLPTAQDLTEFAVGSGRAVGTGLTSPRHSRPPPPSQPRGACAWSARWGRARHGGGHGRPRGARPDGLAGPVGLVGAAGIPAGASSARRAGRRSSPPS